MRKSKNKNYDVVLSLEEAEKLKVLNPNELEKKGIRGKDYLIAQVQKTIIVRYNILSEKNSKL